MSYINSEMDSLIKVWGKDQLEGILDGLDDDDVEYKLDNPLGELHDKMYNEDYFIVGTQNAKDFMGDDTFDVVRAVKEFEENNYGQISTDFSSAEEVVNAYAYIRGEELMDEIIQDYRRDRINNRKRSDRNNNKMFDSGNDFPGFRR